MTADREGLMALLNRNFCGCRYEPGEEPGHIIVTPCAKHEYEAAKTAMEAMLYGSKT
jgi:hypothetical protein